MDSGLQGCIEMCGTWPYGDLRQDTSGLLCESLIKEVVGGTGSGLVGSYMKGMLPAKLFIIFRN